MRRWLGICVMIVAATLFAAVPVRAEQRIALVIANSAYASGTLGRLPGTPGDAQRTQAALQAAGFAVRSVSDANKAQMQRAIADFVRDLGRSGKDGVGFFYYSGHGIADRKRGDNYLMPVDADIDSAEALPIYGLAMDDVLDAIENTHARAAFVVFDACRTTVNALDRGGKGLMPARGRTDTLIAFATQPNQTADDNGLYSRILAQELTRPGATSDTLFIAVQRQVATQSGRRQVPQFVTSLVEPVSFVAAPQETPQAPVALAAPRTSAGQRSPPGQSTAALWGLTEADLRFVTEGRLLTKAGGAGRVPAILDAAEKGDTVAEILAGLAYMKGVGVEKDDKAALAWFRRAVDQGNNHAIIYVAASYHEGGATAHDPALALSWLHRAADAGEPLGMTFIGFMYERGDGVAQDYTQALSWYRRAIAAGDPHAMYFLGKLYQYGNGVPKDRDEALRWYRKAAVLGDTDAKSEVDE